MLQALMVGLVATVYAACPCQNLLGDPAPPVITLNGYSPLYLTCNDPYVELGAKANSICDGNLDDRVTVNNSAVDTMVPGIYTVTYSVTDNCGTMSTKQRIVEVLSDFEFEVLGAIFKIPYTPEGLATLEAYGLIGADDYYDPDLADDIEYVYITLWDCKQTYDDSGAWAFDDCEGDLTSQILVDGVNDVLTSEPNTVFPVIYAIPNPPRDIGPQFRLRLVVVVDYIRPSISLQGEGYQFGRQQDKNYTPPADWWWPECRDRYEEKYPQSHWYFDSLGNPRSSEYDLPTLGEWASDVNAPSKDGGIKEEWNAEPLNWFCDKPEYEDPGAVSFDDCEGYLDPRKMVIAITASSSGACPGFAEGREAFVYVARLGDLNGVLDDIDPTVKDPFPSLQISSCLHGYRIYYFMRDSSGNLVFRQTRLVKPQYGIGFVGIEGTTTVNCGDNFSPTEGVRAYDTCQGDVTNRIVITGTVNTAIPGTYELIYSALNNYGWYAEGSRRIDVVDNTPPQIVLLNEFGDPTMDPTIDIPWCSWRTRAAGELYGVNWWNDQYWRQPYNGWVVEDQCDDNDRLTGEVSLLGGTDIREALEFLKNPRDQEISIEQVNTYLHVYPLYHNVTDENVNHAIPMIRPINIVPTYPEISLIDDLMIFQECGEEYMDEGIGGIRDVLEAGGADGCYAGAPGYFVTSYKIVPPEVAPDSVAYLPYDMAAPPAITIDEFILGDHKIMFRATNPLGYANEVTRTIRVGDNHGPEIEPEFVNYVSIIDGVYQFDCLNVQQAGISEFLTFTASDSCDGNITDEVEYEIIREELPNGTSIYTVHLSVTDTGGNLTEVETDQFVSVSTNMPTLDLGTWSSDVDGPFLLTECHTPFAEPDDFVGLDGCGSDLGAPQAALEEDEPGVLAWAWVLDETGEPLWQENEESVLEPVLLTYNQFRNIPGDYLLVYTSFDLWSNTYPELDEENDLPPLFDVDGNLLRDGDGNLTVDFARLVRVVDRVRPVITLNGDPVMTINCGVPFTDPGATAQDGCDGNLNSAVVLGGDTLDITVIGAYVLTYDVSDSAGNAATPKTRTITVIDSIVPTITLLGLTEVTLECGAGVDYEDAGVLASDGCVGDVTDLVVVNNTVDPAVIGDYTVIYSVVDNDGNEATSSRIVHVVDTTPPALTLLESDIINVECGFEFMEPGYLAVDACSGDISETVVVGGDTVDTTRFGVYEITYTVSDALDNQTESARTVNVVDTTPPTITLPGDNPVNTAWGEPYSEPAGYAALDACDGDLTNEVIIEGEELVDTNIIGSYTVRYTVEDAEGNLAEESRTVNVVDPAAPEVILNGEASLTLECGGEFTDPGATATDAIDGDLTADISVVVNPNMMYVPGVYAVVYRVVNSRGSSSETQRSVTVTDTVAPTIALRGAAAVTIDCSAPLFILDDYAFATDICDSKPVVTRIGDVDTDTPGVYNVQYTATDTEANMTQTSLTVTVRNNCAPVEEGEVEGENEGEMEGEGEGEPEECTGCRACLGCCPNEEGKWLPKDWLGDWLLIGLSVLVLAAFATSRQHK